MSNLYSIYDTGAQDTALVFLASNDTIARRMVMSMAVPGEDFFDHAEDFSLYKLGEMDERDLLPCDRPEFVNLLSTIISYRENEL